MSLNPMEQTVHDYLTKHAEESRHWREKIARVTARAANQAAAVDEIAAELEAYCRERAGVVPAFRDLVGPGRGGPRRLMLRTLAEKLVRAWGPVWKKAPPAPGAGGMPNAQ
jgi:hypothetical protein